MRQMAPTQLGVSQCGNFVWNLSRAGRESAGQRGAEAACDRPRQTAPRPPPRVVSRLARTEKTSGASSNMSSRKCRRAPPSAARAAVAASLSPRALLCCPASLPPASALCALYDDATSANCCLASLTSFACACVSCPSDERKSTRWYGRPEGSPAALSRRAPDTRAMFSPLGEVAAADESAASTRDHTAAASEAASASAHSPAAAAAAASPATARARSHAPARHTSSAAAAAAAAAADTHGARRWRPRRGIAPAPATPKRQGKRGVRARRGCARTACDAQPRPEHWRACIHSAQRACKTSAPVRMAGREASEGHSTKTDVTAAQVLVIRVHLLISTTRRRGSVTVGDGGPWVAGWGGAWAIGPPLASGAATPPRTACLARTRTQRGRRGPPSGWASTRSRSQRGAEALVWVRT